MEDRQFSLGEVAGFLGVSERTVRRWIDAGKFKAYKPGRDYRIMESDLRAFVEDSEVAPKVAGQLLLPLDSDEAERELARVREEFENAADAVGAFCDHWIGRIEGRDIPRGEAREFHRAAHAMLQVAVAAYSAAIGELTRAGVGAGVIDENEGRRDLYAGATRLVNVMGAMIDYEKATFGTPSEDAANERRRSLELVEGLGRTA